MRVLFLQQQPCIRALKYAVALRSAFPGIQLGFAYQGKTLSGWYGTGDELFERWWNLGSEPLKGLRQVGEEFRPDLIHSHNLPDSLTAIALELFAGRVPVVHDVHDLQSLRRTPYEHGFPEPVEALALEQLAIEGCSRDGHGLDELSEEIEPLPREERRRSYSRTTRSSGATCSARCCFSWCWPTRCSPPRLDDEATLSTYAGLRRPAGDLLLDREARASHSTIDPVARRAQRMPSPRSNWTGLREHRTFCSRGRSARRLQTERLGGWLQPSPNWSILDTCSE